MSDWLRVAEAAKRLGIKPATLYAYVSRGVLHRRRGEEGHSLFDPVEIERLALRGRPRRRPAPSEVVIESQLTALGPDRPYYRGRDALDLAARLDLETVAAWLWTGDPAVLDAPAGGTWLASPEAVAAGRAAQSGLPDDVLPLDRLQVIAPALAASDPGHLTLDPAAVIAVGQSLIAGMVDSLPALAPSASAAPDAAATPSAGAALAAGAAPAAGLIRGTSAISTAGRSNTERAHPHHAAAGPIAERLWTRLTPGPVQPDLVDALRVALVLVADHELAASTLAARVAASVRADPYAVVSAGLGVMGGALHGGASLGAEALLAGTREPDHARQVLALRLRRGERIPGLGHTVYRDHDGRATYLLDQIRSAAPGSERLAVAEAVLVEARRRRLPGPNIEYALAVLASVAGMVSGAGEAVFALGRTVGWLAHALEEYAHPTRLRLRASYVGPSLGGGGHSVEITDQTSLSRRSPLSR